MNLDARATARLRKLLFAIAQGYKVSGEDDRYIVVENPDYREPDGDPNLVLDVYGFFGIPEEEAA